jgi:peptidyl-prolyl cis-trans isomerase B (cyclophilin B)
MNITLRCSLLTLLCALTPAFAQGETQKPKSDPPQKQGEKPKDDKGKADKPKNDPVTDSDPVIMALDEFAKSKKVDTKSPGWKFSLPMPPKQAFAAGRTYWWHLATNKGDVNVQLLSGVAPMHVTSTIFLTRLGFYDGLAFHRVIKNFMAQGGDPRGNGSGGPGYQFGGEFDEKVKHDKPGMLSMANAGPGTDGSQFFLTFVPTPWLNGKHSIFGRVVEGLDTLKALEAAGSEDGHTSEKLEITRAWITVTENKADLKDETKGEQKKEEKKDEKKDEKKGEGK